MIGLGKEAARSNPLGLFLKLAVVASLLWEISTLIANGDFTNVLLFATGAGVLAVIGMIAICLIPLMSPFEPVKR